jgi:sterol desaturase/sphingolipid hydroxylase (fatty acid hydroxylase superfamily)
MEKRASFVLWNGGRMALVDLKTLLIAALIFIPLERLFAMHPAQKIFRKSWLNDVVYLFLNGLLIKLGLAAVILPTMAASLWIVPASLRDGLRGLPLWLQLPAVILIADIGFYWAHRMFHSVPSLWKFHVIHHSIEELDWLAAHRVHPIDQTFTKAASFIPIFALGFSEAAIGLFAVIFYWHALLIHANVRIGIGPLQWLICSPRFHHWHHSNDLEARNKNFAGQLSFLDLLFGTIYLPSRRKPGNYGTDELVPLWYADQLLDPFRRHEGLPREQ